VTTKKRRLLTINDVRKRFGKLGLTIIDEAEFVNSKSKMTAVDEEGYKVYLLVNRLPYLKSYRRFDKNNPYTIDNIKLWLKINDPDYELVSKHYNGSEEKLEWRKVSRPDLPTFFTSWHMFYSDGNRHPDLAVERYSSSKRRKPKQVRLDIEKRLQAQFPQWSLDENEEYKYRTAKKSLMCITHKEGFKSTITYDSIHTNKAITLFHPKKPLESIHNIELWTNKYSQYWFVKNQKYTTFRGKYKFICDKHGEFTNNFSTIYSYDTGCQECIYEAFFREGNPNWNPDITDEEREERHARVTVEYLRWRNSVLKRDNYICICCGETTLELLEVHHKNSFHWCIEGRTDISNGETLCKHCHKDFHMTFGYRDNTEQQFEEYLYYRLIDK